MKEAELAAIKRDTEIAEKRTNAQNARDEMEKNERNDRSSEDSPKGNLEKRTPGNGEDASSPSQQSEQLNSEVNESRKLMRDSRDSERPDGKESESSSKSPLIEVEKGPQDRTTKDHEDLFKIENLEKNMENLSGNDSFQNSSKKNDKTDENVCEEKTESKRRNTDERTRLRVYRDAVDTKEAKSSGNIVKDGKSCHGNEEIEIIDCIESETNSAEFEMVSSQPESDESPENSLETLRLEKVVTTKIGKNVSLPEEVNLIA